MHKCFMKHRYYSFAFGHFRLSNAVILISNFTLSSASNKSVSILTGHAHLRTGRRDDTLNNGESSLHTFFVKYLLGSDITAFNYRVMSCELIGYLILGIGQSR